MYHTLIDTIKFFYKPHVLVKAIFKTSKSSMSVWIVHEASALFDINDFRQAQRGDRNSRSFGHAQKGWDLSKYGSRVPLWIGVKPQARSLFSRRLHL